jgi:hypothetical protein
MDVSKLDEDDVLEFVKLKKSTWRVYVSTGKAPKKDGQFPMSKRRPGGGPFWYRETIERWLEERNRKFSNTGKPIFIKTEAYDTAAEWIALGMWEVYPEWGVIDLGGGGRISVAGGGMGYLVASVNWVNDIGRTEYAQVYLHRVIWEHREGIGDLRKVVPEGLVVEHKNRIPYDNRVANMQEITVAQKLATRRQLHYGDV